MSFTTATSVKTKGPAVQAEEQETHAQAKGFSDPKVNDQSAPTALGALHGKVQAKLTVGTSGDKFEKEADETAEKVMAMPEVQKTHADGNATDIQKKASRSEDEPDISKKEENDLQPDVKENTISKKSFLQTALFNDEKDVRNDFINAKFEFPGVPAIAEPVKKPGSAKPKKKAIGKKGKKAPAKQGAAMFDVPVPKKKKVKEAKPPKIQKKEEDAPEVSMKMEETPVNKKSFLQTFSEEEGVQKKEDKDIQPKEEVIDKKSFLQTVSEDEKVQTKNGSGGTSESFEGTLKSSKGGGSKMSDGLSSDMEGRFGRDFSGVRIHTDSNAVSMNQEISAKAFTNESDIYFNSGQFNENSQEGKSLLAHELTHTIQQGASGDSIQKFEAEPREKVTPQPPVKEADGKEVNDKSQQYMEEDDDYEPNPPSEAEMDEDDKEHLNPPADEVGEENQKVEEKGVAKTPENKGEKGLKQAEEQKKIVAKKVDQPDKGGEENKKDQTPVKQEKKPLGESELATIRSKQAMERALELKEPEKLKEFRYPRIEPAVDKEGERLPMNHEVDTNVRGLAYLGEAFRKQGLELQKFSLTQEKKSLAVDAVIESLNADLADSKEGTNLAKEQSVDRKDILGHSETAHEEAVTRQQVTEKEAPGVHAQAKSGEDEATDLKSETAQQAEENSGKLGEGPDTSDDGAKQGEDINSNAEGAVSVFDTITMAINAAAQYVLDAATAKEENDKSQESISETHQLIAQADEKIALIDEGNKKTAGQIETVTFGPEDMRKRAASTKDSGDELIAASVIMEIELIDIQEQYFAEMAKVPGKEEAEKRAKEEEEKQQKLSEAQMEVMMIAGMDPEAQKAYITLLPDDRKQELIKALESMEAAPDQEAEKDTYGLNAKEGKRKTFSTGGNEAMGMGGGDIRQPWIDPVEKKRVTRLDGVFDIADQNMAVISVSQKAALADSLAMDSLVSEVKNIDKWEFGKQAIQAMYDPRMALSGVVGSFEKLGTGIANLANWEAWEKDPLGNLLKVGADITTGIAMLAASILGIGFMIQGILVAFTVAGWFFPSIFTIPQMAWMGTIMTVSGYVAMIAGTLSFLFNDLAYMKNLHDAAAAPTSREFLGNVHQMKENATDGAMGLMAIVAGKGGIKMGKGFNMQNVLAPFKTPGSFFKTMKGMMGSIKNKVVGGSKKLMAGFKKLATGGMKEIRKLKDKIKSLFKKNKKTTHGEIKENSVSSQKAKDGHTYERMPDGQVAQCSHCQLTRERYEKELNNPDNAHLKKDLTELEVEIDKIPDGEVIPDDLMKRQLELEDQLGVIKNKTLKQNLPRNNGTWEGTPGNGKWFSDHPDVIKMTNGEGITFRNGYPDLDKYSLQDIHIKGLRGKNRVDFKMAYEVLKKDWGFKSPNAVKQFLKENKLTLHHHPNGKTLQLVPSELHNNLIHSGGASFLRLFY